MEVNSVLSPLDAYPRDQRIVTGCFEINVAVDTREFSEVRAAMQCLAAEIERELETLRAKFPIIVGQVLLVANKPWISVSIQVDPAS